MDGTYVETRELSVPDHADGTNVWAAIANVEILSLFRDEGVPRSSPRRHDDHFASAFARMLRDCADALQPLITIRFVPGKYLSDSYGSRHYSVAKRKARTLRAAYDDALKDVDVLALQTTPHTTHRIDPDLSGIDRVK